HTRGHAMGPYELRSGKLVRSRQGQPTFSDAWAATVERHMERDARVVVVTPAMLEGSSLRGVSERFPGRVFDVGIAEQHSVTFAAGLAHGGLRPIVCMYSTFIQRAYDQLVHDVVLPGLPVVLAVDRAGLVGADGATHQGLFDLALLRALPGLQVAAPVFAEDLDELLTYALTLPAPFSLRFPRGVVTQRPASIPPGDGLRARWLKRGMQLTFVAAGPLALTALEAAQAEPQWGVLDVRAVSPLDEAAVLEAAQGALVTVEEGTPRGGLGSAVLECLARHRRSTPVRVLGLPADRFVRHGDARVQRAELGLDASGLHAAAMELLAP
ncbi:MAG: 1-deoxy-D-xylulose-5-phosphate synthase, partial [Archangium sp.]|nr:1-deoxy-D-xylulose-5-phosphate synthase [Archangium sp.]